MERDACLQDIFTYLLIYLFFSKASSKDRPSMFSKSGASMETDAHASLNIPSGSPVKGPSPEALRTEPVQRERRLIPTATYIDLINDIVELWVEAL
jgi:hypothetical protein